VPYRGRSQEQTKSVFKVQNTYQNKRVYVCSNPRERGHWGDPDVDGRIILRWIFRKWREWRLDGVGSG